MSDDDLSDEPKVKRRGRSLREKSDALEEILRRYSEPIPSPVSEPHPFAKAGPKLKRLRELSGWEAEEIADRTGVRLETLEAFERADSAAAATLDVSDLERLASACCGSLDDLVEAEQISAAKRMTRRRSRSLFDL
ncbi:MAG TPA: helix-turn-helix transcriptional regulator [Thermoanaerobaculia bacterium]|nr:helix-turn-helix transcriptional regulator [Thermoanaerobaculia bacterium]